VELNVGRSKSRRGVSSSAVFNVDTSITLLRFLRDSSRGRAGSVAASGWELSVTAADAAMSFGLVGRAKKAENREKVVDGDGLAAVFAVFGGLALDVGGNTNLASFLLFSTPMSFNVVSNLSRSTRSSSSSSDMSSFRSCE
jgi:hypothetical protein